MRVEGNERFDAKRIGRIKNWEEDRKDKKSKRAKKVKKILYKKRKSKCKGSEGQFKRK